MKARQTILIIDDNRLVRETYRDLFEAQGFAVAEATNGAEALLWLQRRKADLILLDLEMPVMDGRSFLEYRFVHRNIRDIPVLVVSSRLDKPRLRQSLLYLGADRLYQRDERKGTDTVSDLHAANVRYELPCWRGRVFSLAPVCLHPIGH